MRMDEPCPSGVDPILTAPSSLGPEPLHETALGRAAFPLDSQGEIAVQDDQAGQVEVLGSAGKEVRVAVVEDLAKAEPTGLDGPVCPRATRET